MMYTTLIFSCFRKFCICKHFFIVLFTFLIVEAICIFLLAKALCPFCFSGGGACSLPQVSRSLPDPPPPLPPRPKRESSIGAPELSPIRKLAEGPLLPPRESTNTEAPPLPPRRTDMSVFTLPRTQSMTLARPPVSSASMTLPRRNSEREAPPPLNINGERAGSVTPELPPKTYRMTHSRKQSS